MHIKKPKVPMRVQRCSSPSGGLLWWSLNLSNVREPAMPFEASWLVPAPMREEVNESAQPLDVAGTSRIATMKVPAPRLELGTP